MSKNKSKIKKILSFSLYEYWVLIKSWLLYLKWDLRISKTHFKNWQSHILQQPLNLSSSEPFTNVDHKPNQVQKLIKLNEIAGRNHYKPMNCLRRCLCQKELLSGININSKLHIGVKFVDGELAAHSWLSSNNIIINDSEEVISTYKELKTADNLHTLAMFK